MQKCLKFQFQSKILNKKIFVAVFTIIILFSSNTQVFAEPDEKIDISKYVEWSKFTNGKSPDTAEIIYSSKIIFEIGKNNVVHVKQVVEGMVWGAENPKVLKTLPGKHSNLQVTDEDGDYLRPIGFVGKTFEESEYVILGQKAFQSFDLIMEYDLEDFLDLNEDGMWVKQFEFPHDVVIYIDDTIDTVFLNSRGVDVSVAKGINCVGCSIEITFFDSSEPIIKKVFKNETNFEEITNTGSEFILEFFSDGKITNLNYIQELNYFTFNINKTDQLVWMNVPLDLLLSPYHVYLTEFDQEILVEADKIKKSEFKQTETHVDISFKAPHEGVIHVVGATEMEHKTLLEQLEKRSSLEKPTPKSSEPDSLSDILRGEFETVDEEKLIKNQKEELYKDWENTSTDTNSNYDTIIFVIIGIVAVVTIVVIVIKLKKN